MPRIFACVLSLISWIGFRKLNSVKKRENIATITQMKDCNIPYSTVLIAGVLGNQNCSHASSFIRQEHDARVLGRRFLEETLDAFFCQLVTT